MVRRGWVTVLLLLLAGSAGAANVRAVRIQGLKRIGEAQLLKDLPVRVGNEFAQKDADAGKEWLLERGLFLKVELRVAAVGAVVDVLYTVVENPPVRTVMFKGNTQISGAALRADLLTAPGEVLSRRNLWHDAGVIGAEYVRMGLHVTVETSFEPPPADSERPVAVIFEIAELKFHALRCEPAGYVLPDKLAALVVLQPGELLRDPRLLEQGRKLDGSGLFADLGDVAVTPTGEGDEADLVFPATESPQPVLTAENLPLVDLPKLCQVVRLNAVAWQVDTEDMDPWYPAEACQAKLAAAKAALAAQPADGEAAWQVALWTSRSGAAPRPALEAARLILTRAAAGGGSRAHLRLGEVLHRLGEMEQADKELSTAAEDPALKVEALRELLLARTAGARGQEGVDAIRRVVLDGADACAKLPADADLEQLTCAFQLYYAALTVSGLNIGVKGTLRLDGPVGGRLMSAVSALYRQGVSVDEARHLGKLVTAAAFAAHTSGGEVAEAEVWRGFAEVLEAVREELLPQGLDQTPDPTAWFYLGLADILLEQRPDARADALMGLRRQPRNERLVDLCLVAVLGEPGEGERKDAAVRLRAAMAEVEALTVKGELPGWGGLVLTAKLALALRAELPADATAERERTRQAAATAARKATELEPGEPGGWWLLGMALLKGPKPGEAVAPWQKLVQLPRRPPDAAYALALAKLAAGDTAGGLKDMGALR